MNNLPNKSIWPTDETLTSTTTPGQSGHGSNGNERGDPHTPQSLRTGASSPDAGLASYPGYPYF